MDIEMQEKPAEAEGKLPDKRKLSSKIIIVSIIAVVVILAIAGGLLIKAGQPKEEEVLTESSLEKVLDVSELSTFEAVYNGVARVFSEKDPEEVNYYTSYEAKVKLGIDVEKIAIGLNDEEKAIHIQLPPISITDVIVDIGSLDYIFVNKKANTEIVSQEAYKACIADVTNETQHEQTIYKLAEQNAENIVKAMICPFIEQMEDTYSLQISWEG